MPESNGLDHLQRLEPDVIEQEYLGIFEVASPDEQLSLIFDTIGPTLRKKGKLFDEAYSKGSAHIETTKPGGAVRHFLLPDIQGYGDINTIREAPEEYVKTEHRTLISCGQGKMWEVPLSQVPMVGVAMSECSLVFGDTPELTRVFAHISYSEPKEMNAVVQYFNDREIPESSRFAVASVGKFQESKAKSRDRFATVNQYVSAGFPINNIIPFEHAYAFTVIPNGETKGVYSGFTDVLLTPNACMMKQYSAWFEFSKGTEHIIEEPTYTLIALPSSD